MIAGFSLLPDWAARILTALVIFGASWLLAQLLSRALRGRLKGRVSEDNPGITLLGSLLYWGILLLGVLTALNQFFDVTAYLAGLGVAGIAIGFALQDIMQNLASGVLLLIQQPFSIGDWVKIADQEGSVRAMTLRTTELETAEGHLLLIPNAKVLNEVIVNYARAARRRVSVVIGIGYEDDPEVARQALLEAIRDLPGVVHEPAPVVLFQGFGESSVDLVLHFWIDTAQTNVFAARDAAIVRARAALNAAGVEIPYPIRTVYLEKNS